MALQLRAQDEIVDPRGGRDDTKPCRAQDCLEAFQQQKVWPDQRRGEGSSERAIIAGRGNGSVGIALRVILSQISSPLGSGIRGKQLG